MVKNWLLILGLDFDPAPADEAAIKKAIDKKRGEFTNKGNKNTADAAYFRELADAIKAGEADAALLDASARARQAREAQEIVYGKVDAAIEQAALFDPALSEGIEANVAKSARDAIRDETGILKFTLSKDLVVARIAAFKERSGAKADPGAPSDDEAIAVYKKHAEPHASERVAQVLDGIGSYISEGEVIPRDFAVRQVANLAACMDDPEEAPALLMGYALENGRKLGAAYGELREGLTGAESAAPDTAAPAAAGTVGKAAAEAVSNMRTKTKRNIALGVGIAVVAIIAIAIIGSVVGNMQEQQRIEAEHQALVESLGEPQLIENVESLLLDNTWPVSVGRGADYSVQSLTINDKQSTDNLMAADCTVIISDGGIEQTTNATANLVAEDGVWAINTWDFGDTAVKAITEIGASTARRLGYPLPDGTSEFPEGTVVNFDETAQTCTIAYKAADSKWFGGETGELSYAFTFTQSGWQLENKSGEIKAGFNSDALIGNYTAANEPYAKDVDVLTALVIETVDGSTGAISATYTYHASDGDKQGQVSGTIDANGSIRLDGDAPVAAHITCNAGSTAGILEAGSLDISYGSGLADSTTYTFTKN